MNVNIVVALIGLGSSVLIALITAWTTLKVEKLRAKNVDQSDKIEKKKFRFFSVFVKSLIIIYLIIALPASIFQIYKLMEIENSVSTQYVGQFPENLETITQLISETKEKLIIVSDVPAYGHWSAPRFYNEYLNTITDICNLENHPKIKIITYDDSGRSIYSEDQFQIKTSEQLDEYKKSKQYKNYFNYWKRRGNKKEPSTPEELYRLFEKEHDVFRYQLANKGAKFYETSGQLPVFIWIVDDKSAIFSFYNYGKKPREVSFKTRDLRIINVLTEIAETAFEKSEEYYPPQDYDLRKAKDQDSLFQKD